MITSERQRISDARRRLNNPYAYVEDLIELDAERPTLSPVSAARKLLENPYAYLTGAGTYELPEPQATDDKTKHVQSHRYRLASSVPASKQQRRAPRSKESLEADVRNVHERVWSNRVSLWSEAAPSDPVELLDPEVALQLLGYNFQYVEGLGQMRGEGGPIEVAGLIDTVSKNVRVGRQFPAPVRRFTAAHELGHAVLHPHLGVLHQDKVLDGAGVSNDPLEIEANRFATLFLMPAKLVRARFARVFLADQFTLTEETAFALSGYSSSVLAKSAKTLRALARRLAAAERYNGRQIVSLHTQFGVSREAMAIRIEELALVHVDG